LLVNAIQLIEKIMLTLYRMNSTARQTVNAHVDAIARSPTQFRRSAMNKMPIFLGMTCLIASLSFAPHAYAEGKDAVVDKSSTSKKLEALGKVELAKRPLVTVYEVTSSVSEIDPRAATTMFTTALIKSRQFRVMERAKITGGVAKERELNQSGVTSGDVATKQIKGANVVFEATFSEATPSKETKSGGFSIGGLQIGGGSNKDAVGLDVRVLSAGTGEVLDAVNVRKEVEATQSNVSGVGALIDTIASIKGKDTKGLTPDANMQSSRKESMDRALRALIELAIVELAKRAGEWSDE
jgi:curli biogenesis system outer membrane secretion channel CsgG